MSNQNESTDNQKDTTENTGKIQSATTESKNVTFVKQKPKKDLLLVKMYTPYKTFFEGDAKSISALNDTGDFDVLPGHHNFITMLKPCKISIQLPDKTFKKIPIARGLMHVRADKIVVFLDV